MSPEELNVLVSKKEDLLLLDVRQPEEHRHCRLAGSTLIPLRELAARMNELEGWRNKVVVVYCHHGIRSLHAVRFLNQMGFQDVYNLEGGIDRWSAEIDPGVPRY